MYCLEKSLMVILQKFEIEGYVGEEGVSDIIFQNGSFSNKRGVISLI